jgi:hypothetical protein
LIGIFFGVLGLAALVGGTIFIGAGVVQTIIQVKSLSWIPVDAVFDKLEIAESHRGRWAEGFPLDTDPRIYSLVSQYNYEYRGATYTGNRCELQNSEDSFRFKRDWAIRSVRANPSVWVNPANPSQSVVLREDIGLLPILPVGATCVITGCLLCVRPLTRFLRRVLFSKGRQQTAAKGRLDSFLRIGLIVNISCIVVCEGATFLLPFIWSPVIWLAGNIAVLVFVVCRRRRNVSITEQSATFGSHAG